MPLVDSQAWRFSLSSTHSTLLKSHCIILKPPEGKRKVKINLIKVDSVHSKENSGILPSVLLSPARASSVGKRAGGGEPDGPKLGFWLCHSAVSLWGQLCPVAKVTAYRTVLRI